MIIETKRLKLISLDLKQFSLLLEGINVLENEMLLTPSNEAMDEHLQQAMEFMYNEASKHRDEYLWLTNWQIILKSENKSIGSCNFKNLPDENGCVEIGYGINTDYRNKRFMTEALSAMCNWALDQPNVKYVIAETEKDNIASQNVLWNCKMAMYKETDDCFWWRTNSKLKEKTMVIRQEEEKDYPEIYKLIKTAFETAKVRDGDEQDFALNLRNSTRYIPELALVAEQDGKLTGHIMLTTLFVEQTDGNKFEALLVAPLSVLLEYRNNGVGSGLMNESFRIARKMGYKAVFLCGDPDYYGRFSFSESVKYGIKNTNGVPDKYCLAYELFPNTLNGISGSINCI